MSFIIEISQRGSVMVCNMDGSEIDGELLQDLQDCNASGDCEPACRYVLDRYKPEFRIVKQIDGQYQNVIASSQDKAAICKSIYFESYSDFNDEPTADLYLIWQAASELHD